MPFSRKSKRMMFIALSVLMLAVMACLCTDLGSLTTTSAGTPGAPDGGDGYTTTGGGSITVGSSQTATLTELDEAHNWSFQGTSGQTVTITAVGQGETDPRIKLLDPNGNVIAEDDDSGGGASGRDATLTTTLPSDGLYTVRVDVFRGGTYTVTVQ